MMNSYKFKNLMFFLITSLLILNPILVQAQKNKDLIKALKSTHGLVALWDFKEPAGQDKISNISGNILKLKEVNKPISRVKGGPLSGYGIALDGNAFLSIPYDQTGVLNVTNNQVTVIAWIKRQQNSTGFIGGMWNEHVDGGRRQYGLFTSLPHYNGADQVCGHISKTGKPTPPFPYSIDYSASAQTIPSDRWVSVAFTYDGTYIKSYLDGVFESRAPELILNTKGFEGYSEGLIHSKNPYYFPDGIGDNGSDFTVGSVFVSGKMGNFFKGEIGGLAVFDRALTSKEMLNFK